MVCGLYASFGMCVCVCVCVCVFRLFGMCMCVCLECVCVCSPPALRARQPAITSWALAARHRSNSAASVAATCVYTHIPNTRGHTYQTQGAHTFQTQGTH
eukprot:COSAG06_NODE_11744_length_1468_cov_2.043034_1_plen_99_part_10